MYSRNAGSKELAKVVWQTNHIILEKSLPEKIYTVNVVGTSSCAYQISLGRTDRRIYEVFDGAPYDLQLN